MNAPPWRYVHHRTLKYLPSMHLLETGLLPQCSMWVLLFASYGEVMLNVLVSSVLPEHWNNHIQWCHREQDSNHHILCEYVECQQWCLGSHSPPWWLSRKFCFCSRPSELREMTRWVYGFWWRSDADSSASLWVSDKKAWQFRFSNARSSFAHVGFNVCARSHLLSMLQLASAMKFYQLYHVYIRILNTGLSIVAYVMLKTRLQIFFNVGVGRHDLIIEELTSSQFLSSQVAMVKRFQILYMLYALSWESWSHSRNIAMFVLLFIL